LVKEGRVVALTTAAPDPFHPVDLAAGESQPVGALPATSCDPAGATLAPGSYEGRYLLEVDVLASAAELATWPGSAGEPATIVSVPFEVVVAGSGEGLGSRGCGDTLPTNAILTG